MSNFREVIPQWLQNGCRKNFNIIKYEHISDAPVDSQGGYGIVEKIFPPSKITLPLHRFIKEFQKKIFPPHNNSIASLRIDWRVPYISF